MNGGTVGSDIILDRLLTLHPKIIDLTLDRLHRLLDRLGNPERNLPPVVHVAGTNGKGSTLAVIRAGIEAAGKTCHVYTSPHLARFHERIRLAGDLIGPFMGHVAIGAGRPNPGAVGVVDRGLELLEDVVTHLMATGAEGLSIGQFHCGVEAAPEDDAGQKPADGEKAQAEIGTRPVEHGPEPLDRI